MGMRQHKPLLRLKERIGEKTMDLFRSVANEVSEETYKNITIEVKVPGQPVREFKPPIIITSVDNGVVSGNFIGSGPAEILLAIGSMVNVYRSMAGPGELTLLGDLLCLLLQDIAGDIERDGGGAL